MKIILPLLFVLIFGLTVFGQDTKPSKNLYQLKKIFVGEMGKTDEAERFRILLADALGTKGFTVVDKSEDADAVLSGILIVRTYDDKSSARATVAFKSKYGERFWSGDFEPKFVLFKRVPDTVKARAEEIADKFFDDWQKTAKAAGVKTAKPD